MYEPGLVCFVYDVRSQNTEEMLAGSVLQEVVTDLEDSKTILDVKKHHRVLRQFTIKFISISIIAAVRLDKFLTFLEEGLTVFN